MFGLYLGRSSVASAFGAAGSLVVLMVWVYYSAQIFLLGAEFTRVYAYEHGSRAELPAVAPAQMLPRVKVVRAANDPKPVAAKSAIKLGAAAALGLAAAVGLRLFRKGGQ